MKKLQKTIASVAFMLCFALLFQSIKVQAAADTDMTIYGIYLESQDKGESVLLESRGHYLLMELGSAGSVPAIVKQLKKLGIRCIWLPIVAMVVASVIGVSFGVENLGIDSNLPSLATGIVLILASMIFRYGAALEETCKC